MEATDGDIGKVKEMVSGDDGRFYVVVDTGRWIFQKKRLIPAGAIEDVVAEGDKVVVRWKNAGTDSGGFMGMPPTGKQFGIAGIDIHVVRDRRMVEHWHVVDLLSQMQQLGLVPSPGAIPA